MKIDQDTPDFKPVIITLESQAEVNALFSVLDLYESQRSLPDPTWDSVEGLRNYLFDIAQDL